MNPPCPYQDAPIGLCFFDVDLRYVHINDWLANINGLSVEDHIGQTLRAILPKVADGAEAQLRSVLGTGEPLFGRIHVETAAHAGERRHYEHTYSPAKPNGGDVTGVHCVIQDITDRVEAAAAEDKARLELLSDREADVLGLVVTGWTSKSIASKLNLSTATVKTYRVRIMDKLELEHLPALIKFAIRSGVTSA